LYCIEFDGEAQFVTADPKLLFESLEGVRFEDCGKLRVILLSSEDWERDDITAFVWEAMVDDYGSDYPRDTLEEWDEFVGIKTDFIRWGFDEFNPNAERARRKAEADAKAKRFAKFRSAEPAFLAAAE